MENSLAGARSASIFLVVGSNIWRESFEDGFAGARSAPVFLNGLKRHLKHFFCTRVQNNCSCTKNDSVACTKNGLRVNSMN